MDRKNKKKLLLLNITFYVMIVILLGFMIIPHTSFAFRKRIFIPFGLRLNKEDVVIQKGDSFHLAIVGVNKRAAFKSTDFKVATVNINGVVKAKRVGHTFIKVYVDKKVLKCRVRVIDINKKEMKLKVGQKDKLKTKGIYWFKSFKSSNKSIVTINRRGVVKAVAKGSAIVSVKVKGITMKCEVIVN